MQLNKNHIELKFFDFDITHQEISTELNIEATHMWYKNEEYVMGTKVNPIQMKRKQSYWGYKILTVTNDYIGNQIDDYINNLIKPRIAIIQKLSKKYHGEFSIVQYMYDGCNPGVFLDPKQLEIINQCRLGLNIDFYVMTEGNQTKER